MYARRAESIIKDHNISTPMYMYLPFQAVHQPLQVYGSFTALKEKKNMTQVNKTLELIFDIVLKIHPQDMCAFVLVFHYLVLNDPVLGSILLKILS
jgi:hypothetical protein